MFSSGNSVCSKAALKHTTELVTLLSWNVKVCDRASSDIIATFPLLEDVWWPAGRRDRYPLVSLCLPLCLRVGLVYALPSGKCFPPDAWTDTVAVYPPLYRNVKTKSSDSLCPRSPDLDWGILRNTWVHRRHGERSSTSLNAWVWPLTLKFRPAGFSLCSFCGPAFMVGALGKADTEAEPPGQLRLRQMGSSTRL